MTDKNYVPSSRAELAAREWDEIDVLLVSGDAHVDHPSFGAVLLGRWLIARGFRVGLVCQPRWDRPDDVAALGRPRLFAGVSAGAMDSMLAHYTALRRRRRDDAYTPGGAAGARPDRACIVYTSLLKGAFPGLPVVLGGIEASMRRASHYDFWSGRVRRSILLDSKADLIVYGMGERAILAGAQRLAAERARGGDGRGPRARELLAGIPGTVAVGVKSAEVVPAGAEVERLPSHEEIMEGPARLIAATLALERQVHEGSWATQECGGRELVLAPPAAPLTTAEMDALYALPFTRTAHPSYREAVPALAMIQFSITTHRGCGGGCSFCALGLHQGRRISSRSRASIVAEARGLASHPDFKGEISDLGGPSANLWGARCEGDAGCGRPSCLHPRICARLVDGQRELIEVLREVARLPGVGHVRVASGVRHDLALRCPEYVQALVAEFTGGQLKIAPEHCCAPVLDLMRKPSFAVFEQFRERFEAVSAAAGKEQYLVPYLISAFPGCTDAHMAELAGWLKKRNWRPRQVQGFIPTPGTLATAMFHAQQDAEGRPLHVARTDEQRRRQHALLRPDLFPRHRTRKD
jgi:uncharacterized radical SAM protein YgiQ